MSTTGTAIAVRGAAAVAGLDVVGVNDDDIRNARSVLRRHTDQADHELACVVCGGVVPCLPVRLAGELLTRASWVPRGGTADRAAVPGAWGIRRESNRSRVRPGLVTATRTPRTQSGLDPTAGSVVAASCSA